MATIKPWHQVLELREDILKETLSQREFAADLYDVLMGSNPSVYHAPKDFFALTYPTTRLRDLARDVALCLAGKSDKAVRQLQLTYGGGKTHALLTLLHLFGAPDKLPRLNAVLEFEAHIGFAPPKAHVGAVVFDRLDPVKGMAARAPSGEIRFFKLPWSVLAWQIAGQEGLDTLGAPSAERETPPYTNVLEELFHLATRDGHGLLILLDEVLMWARGKAGEDREWLPRMRDFFQHLTQAAVRVERCCVVASLLASDVAMNDALGKEVEKELSDVFQRVAEERVQPVDKQDVAEVLRRRLFTPESYAQRGIWKQHVVAALKGICELDSQTKQHLALEDERFLAAYPFHPDMTDVLFEKWTQMDGFQRTRGALRIFAMAMRDARKWGDPSLLVGPSALLSAPGQSELSHAVKELATIASQDSGADGRQQDWNAILQGELKKARDIQDEGHSLKHREMEQAVMSAFLHSQPQGQRAQAQTRELQVLAGSAGPDPINFSKGLARWAEVSWYLDDTFTAGGELPKSWRLGSKPNLRQMHHEARSYVSDAAVEEVLRGEIERSAKLYEGAQHLGAKVHKLPTHPGDVVDDGLFHYVVLGPKAVSEAGRPSSEARRFIEETTSSNSKRPNPNAIVLAVPSRDGLDAARDKVRDWLGWEEVRSLLKTQELDTSRQAHLEGNRSASANEMRSAAFLAYTIVVTLGVNGDVLAFRLAADNVPLFQRIIQDTRSRIMTRPINAEALLPEGPFKLWQSGEQFRYVKDLVGAFGSTARLPKMLDRQATLETVVSGCVAGLYVLRVTRPDRSQVTYWHTRPDAVALADPSLELVLPEAATLTQIDANLLTPGTLPGLWATQSLTLEMLHAYFSGQHVAQIDLANGTEPRSIPAVPQSIVDAAVCKAVEYGHVRYRNEGVCLQNETIPPGFLADIGELIAPLAPLAPGEILQAALPDVWRDGMTDAHTLFLALAENLHQPLPWYSIRESITTALRIGLLEVEGEWPVDLPLAGSVLLRTLGPQEPDRTIYRPEQRRGEATLHSNELQELGEQLHELLQVASGIGLEFGVEVRLSQETSPDNATLEQINAFLGKIKSGWEIR